MNLRFIWRLATPTNFTKLTKYQNAIGELHSNAKYLLLTNFASKSLFIKDHQNLEVTKLETFKCEDLERYDAVLLKRHRRKDIYMPFHKTHKKMI